MHEKTLQAVGIEVANCSTCSDLGSEDDGNFAEFSVSWLVCRQFASYEHLKSFPFKKEMKCWTPEFWNSKFTDLIKGGEESEVLKAIDAFVAARDSA